MTPRTRTILFNLSVVALFLLPLLPETLGTRRLVFRDAQVTHWPWRRVAMEAWRERQVAFINPSASGGQPLLANPNAALLYPTLLLELVLPAASAFNLHYLLHVLWAFFGARSLARRLNFSPGPAFVSGVTYAFSGMMLSYGSAFLNSAAAAAWLPWCAAALLDLVRAADGRARMRAAGATAIAFGMQLLAGEPAISLLTVLFAGALVIGSAFGRSRSRPPAFGSLLIGVFAAGLGALALAAPLLAPLSAIFRFTYRGQHLYSARAFGASPFALWRMIEWFFPRFSGDPGALGAEGHWQYALHPGDPLYIWCVSFGVVPLLLLVCAALSRDFWDRRTRWLAGGAGTTLLFAFGSSLPFYRVLYSVDWMRRLRYPIKFYLLTTICVALLTGRAVEIWKSRRGGRRQFVLLAAVALLYAGVFLAAHPAGALDLWIAPRLTGLKAPMDTLLTAIHASLRGDALLGLVATAVVAVGITPRRRARGEGHLLGLAILLLALPWGLPLFVSADEKALERAPAVLSSLKGPGRLYIAPSLPEFNVLVSGTAHPQLPPRVSQFARIQVEELIPATGSPFGVQYVFDQDPDGSYGYCNRLATEVLSASTPPQVGRILRAFGARWILEDDRERLTFFRPVTGFEIAGRRLVLSEITDPLPELRWAGREYRRAYLSGALELVRSDTFEPASDIVLPGRVNQDSSGDQARASFSASRSRPDSASADVNASAAGYVLFSRTFFQAWKARVDGRPAAILLANGRDLAVAVPSGQHHVDFDYDRRPFVKGVGIQAVCCLALLLLSRIQLSRGS